MHKHVRRILSIHMNNDLGAAHTEELYYLFNAKRLEVRKIEQPSSFPTEHDIQQSMIELWTNFAKTGYLSLII